MVAVVAADDSERALAVLRALPIGREAACIGTVTDGPAGVVALMTRLGSRRLLDLLSGEQLPRIC
jgi:hydrogenase expression/formation protein HypE